MKRPRGGTKKIALDPAESSAIEVTHLWDTGMTPVGAGVRRVELWMGGLRLGDPTTARL
ncbi:hypothetical protein EES43_15135 [Streptomyces sp. ADI96-02]|nr:hypothetical protein EES43_15135 [Streptomyces sp. ADI96-02]